MKNNSSITLVDSKSQIPLFGLDFLGIVDRGTNVLEIKTHTICQFKCKYCFVSAGGYHHNFSVEKEYLVQWIKKAIDQKDCDDIELHFAPYGEILLYKPFLEVIQKLKDLPKIKILSAQSNGMLLNEEWIEKLEKAGLDRLNISLNSMDPVLCSDLCGFPKYDVDHILHVFDTVLKSSMELCIAPVWFMGKNDDGIYDIIKYVKNKEKLGNNWPKLRLGIQNYLEYKTGRRIKGVFPRDFKYFYEQLQDMETQYGVKLKLGPDDFDIHHANPIPSPFTVGDRSNIQILLKGRFKNEYIGALNADWAVKVLSKRPLKINGIYEVKYIKTSLMGNLLTAIVE